MQTQRHTEADRLLGDLYDLTGAFIAGLITQLMIKGAELSELDRLDFREWLVLQGADYSSAYRSPIVKALYDTMFQYPDGLTSSPSYGAGTAANVVLRLLGTYKGSADLKIFQREVLAKFWSHPSTGSCELAAFSSNFSISSRILN